MFARFKKQYIDWKYKKHGNPLEVLLELFPEKPWCWGSLSSNPCIGRNYIFENPDKPWNWSWGGVPQNPNILIRDVLNHPQKSWGFSISVGPDVDPNRLFNPKGNRRVDHWDLLEVNIDMKMKEILETQNKNNWCWGWISENPNITLGDILKYIDKPWEWNRISDNKFLNIDITFNREIKNSIKSRREKVKKLKLYGDLDTIINKYVGYV
jgi:hypothetical protein